MTWIETYDWFHIFAVGKLTETASFLMCFPHIFLLKEKWQPRSKPGRQPGRKPFSQVIWPGAPWPRAATAKIRRILLLFSENRVIASAVLSQYTCVTDKQSTDDKETRHIITVAELCYANCTVWPNFQKSHFFLYSWYYITAIHVVSCISVDLSIKQLLLCFSSCFILDWFLA